MAGGPSRAEPSLRRGGAPLLGCPLHPPGTRSILPRGSRSSLTRRKPPAPGRGRGSVRSGASRCPVACGGGRAPGRWESPRSRWDPRKVSPSPRGNGIRAEFVPAEEMPPRHGGGVGGEAAAGAGARAGGGQPASALGKTFLSGGSSPERARCPALPSSNRRFKPHLESRDGERGTKSGRSPLGASRAGSPTLSSPCAAPPWKGNWLQAPLQLPFSQTFSCEE